jgi:hypothetical protein
MKGLVLIICVGTLAFTCVNLVGAETNQGKNKLVMNGRYVEGCSCGMPCPCELTGVQMGCEGVGGFEISSGSINGMKLDGVKIAYATAPGKWVTCYVDAKTEAGRMAGETLCKAAFSTWGEMGPVKTATITISGKPGEYTLKVDGGAVAELTTTSVSGGDKKGPMVYSNINSPLHPVVMQAKTVKCTYSDEGKSFTVEDGNAYFNSSLKVKSQF